MKWLPPAVNLILYLPFLSLWLRLFYCFCLYCRIIATSTPVSFGFAQFCLQFNPYPFLAVAIMSKSCISTALFLEGPQCILKFSQRSSLRSTEKKTIAALRFSKTHTHSHTLSLVASQMSISNHSHTKLLPTLFTDIFSLVSHVVV